METKQWLAVLVIGTVSWLIWCYMEWRNERGFNVEEEEDDQNPWGV